MDTVLLSDLERFYIIQGAELGCRTDGRAPNEYRPLELETGILSHAGGSASVRVGETYLMGCVKVEVGKTLLTRPNDGRIEINVECYPTATYVSTDRSASELSENLKMVLLSAYSADLLDLRKLCIQPGRQCWIVYIDLLLLEGGGNFLDAASIVIKAALLDFTNSLSSRHPTSQPSVDMKGSIFRFENERLPLFVTVHKVGNSHIVDASKEEEACSLSRLSVVVYPDGVLGPIAHEGCGSCRLETIMEMSELAKTVGIEMNSSLTKTLSLERQLRS
ncbi:unnamed protein product [Dicrocoelium dendriticum]|nr:unnamed protein product [Dicrocoelium dendriticum]